MSGLVSRCVAGNDEARAQFYTTYIDVVRIAVLRTLGRGGSAEGEFFEGEDLCSDIFERLFANDCRMLGTLRSPKSVNSWLTTVSRNYVISSYRRRLSSERMERILVRESSFQYTEAPSESLMKEEERDQVRGLLDAMAPEERLVLELYYLHDLKYHEVADMLGLNINTFSARLRRAKETLRAMVEGRRDE